MSEKEVILSVEDLVVEFKTERGLIRAVDKVSFVVNAGETLGIVGESGCGKSVTSLSIIRLIPSPPGKITHGDIKFRQKSLLPVPESEMRTIRGKDISMIFQEPMTALNPVFTIGNQMIDVLKHHKGFNTQQAREAAIEMLKLVRIPLPEKRLNNYPHQLSGGMRQRVMIAMALSCRPALLIADEPTTALDVTTQAQVLEEMNVLQRKFNMSMILVTHDLGVVAETCQRVIVMYCGRIVEAAKVDKIFSTPRHPYTKGLLESIPKIRDDKLPELPTIEGMVPDLAHLPKGCLFADRCDRVQDKCRQETPNLTEIEPGAEVACFFPEGEEPNP